MAVSSLCTERLCPCCEGRECKAVPWILPEGTERMREESVIADALAHCDEFVRLPMSESVCARTRL
eukprot:654050-Pelagomonas_calceolata.AAC.4